MVEAPTGSSPLARGLQPPALPQRLLRRIIPARAGFTPRTSLFSRPPRDHPRSRGVYARKYVGIASAIGSSPLARGLLCVCLGVGVQAGIIPARAGFTACHAPCVRASEDHPRSRGVYAGGDGSFLPRVGSSPLARGLPVRERSTVGQGRIIPARAGFTSDGGEPTCAVADHPRSRGVYRAERIEDDEEFGSSPLARGLLGAARVLGELDGIIPARAGFT